MTIYGFFEWDEGKRELNLTKHGLDFYEAVEAFNDENAIHLPDLRKDYGEHRIMLVALASGALLSVLYTPRNFRIRIISARFANKKERKRYDSRTDHESGLH